jgi:hypothetical protein
LPFDKIPIIDLPEGSRQSPRAGGDAFDHNRWNNLHYTNAFKQASLASAERRVATTTERTTQ